MTMAEVLQKGREHFGKNMSNFPFTDSVYKRLVLQTHKSTQVSLVKSYLGLHKPNDGNSVLEDVIRISLSVQKK